MLQFAVFESGFSPRNPLDIDVHWPTVIQNRPCLLPIQFLSKISKPDFAVVLSPGWIDEDRAV
jgi:hypothetical protein